MSRQVGIVETLRCPGFGRGALFEASLALK